MAEQALLEVEGVARHFSGVQAVSGATLAVQEGLVTGLIGPNGAGKSTLVGIIAGVVAADAGRVVYQGTDITGLAPHLRARRGLIRTFQSSSEFGRLTVLENLVVAGQAQRGESFMRALVGGRRSWVKQERAIVRRAQGLLARFELEATGDEYAENLSGGQKRILELMRALMADPGAPHPGRAHGRCEPEHCAAHRALSGAAAGRGSHDAHGRARDGNR